MTRIVRSLAELRDLTRDWRAAGATIGVVPTMGALHDGHLSLVRAAQAECDRVIVTLFVNPRQFNNAEDFAKYPRTEDADAAILSPLGADVLFVPDAAEVYPPGHATTISVSGVSEPLEGAHRPGHFDGVATVVALLFNMTQADRAYFGEKDWQQLQVVRRMVADLHLPIQIVPCPAIRAADGLALSSRNQRLSPDARARAALLPAVLLDTAARIEAGGTISPTLAGATVKLVEAGLSPVEYLELRDAESLGEAQPGRPARLLVAAWLDGVRLIDNVAVTLPAQG
ncbi:pantoate--beta-alanine ligase [Paracoccus litorisediminis]|jgi:pantoate--beta-alanine ligase|uniref:Pantothenate synthetase n=1 Tax=Paracoccus litorisediminis TaxID=2006130 RepID=A0A844HR25_9RHOB|nr:pantoate--beta-alanine ligase [Paracoccus litorisediminis]MTH60797.1 pantoate--beta-alanine ligase [Paracoccus litorisediminis]